MRRRDERRRIRATPHLARSLILQSGHNQGGLIRIFGVGLLAVAAIAAAGLWFSRRHEDLVIGTHTYRRGELDGLRAAGL
jgi:hypothetical protein